MLAEFAKNYNDTELYRKVSATDLDQWPLMLRAFFNHYPSSVYKIECISDLEGTINLSTNQKFVFQISYPRRIVTFTS